VLETTAGPIEARWVVNAAGLQSDIVDRLFGHLRGGDRFTVTPRRGELIVFDKLARALVGRTILPVPTATTKGVLVAPTVFGNVVLGPTAEDVPDRTAPARPPPASRACSRRASASCRRCSARR
jgi:glycerol-3-phosphate dehydrogenase